MDAPDLAALRADDSPTRDLRRGALRTLPFLLIAVPLAGVAGGIVAAIAVATLCALWIPLTLIEGVVRRRISPPDAPAVLRPMEAAKLVALVWVLAALAGLNLAVQVQYLAGLERGLAPGDAFGVVKLHPDYAQGALWFGAVLGSIAALHTVIRLEEQVIREHRGHPTSNNTLNAIAGQALVFGLVVAALFASGPGEAFATICGGALVGLVWQCVAVLVVWTFTTGTDGIERQVWS